ncbi:MAG: patatin-like phospholipase family protein [Anaerolineae bacterium]|nr:patatin-like phospholipase family protein [Anaerolineae bacterium]
MKIGLALSGGGMRASVFHFGVLARLADEGLLEDVTAISTVSGGSLGIGLVYAANGNRWPTSDDYRRQVVPRIRHVATTVNLQQSYLSRLLRAPLSLLRPRAGDVSRLMQELWGITARLNALPTAPLWLINATCYETGVNWRFAPGQMGDYLFGYSPNPDLPLADALAASGAFPGLIGPLRLDARPYRWYAHGKETPHPPPYDRVHLWDGGVYENLGVEALFKPGEGYVDNVDFMLTSDAGATPGGKAYSPFTSAYRLVSLATNQVRSLRARMVVAHLQAGNPGSYLQIDNSAAFLLRHPWLKDTLAEHGGRYLPESEVRLCATMESTLRQMTPAEFERLFRHGFEVADVTMHVFKSGGSRPLRGYDTAAWQ